MSVQSDALAAAAVLGSSEIFGELSHEQRLEIWSHARIHTLFRGEILVPQNAPSDAVYIVVSGRFEAIVEGRAGALAEIGVGEPIGEIGFFSGKPRTATVVAVRDSVVLGLHRAEFESVAREVPAIYQTLLRATARKLAETSARVLRDRAVAPARTVAFIPSGVGGSWPALFQRFSDFFRRQGNSLVLTREDVNSRFPESPLDDPAVSNGLNAIEREHELIVYWVDEGLTDWTRKAIRQADQILMIAYQAVPDRLNAVESHAMAMHPSNRRRLVRVHDRRVGHVEGTAAWLRDRDVAMHHHVALQDDLDFRSLHRFLTGRAVGFVAAGGGGLGSAHLGIYKAFQERGISFDILGGVSVGAAMLAGLAILASPEEIDRGTEDVFVTSRSFKRRTFPRYALLDHLAFDEALRRQYKDTCIEDAWRPYFAVATALDRAGDALYLLRRGPLWKAVRASGSIPGVLPPVFTEDGHMLVDGGVVDNIPLEPMKLLKAGPNVVVHFGVRDTRFNVDYASIPGRWQLLRRMLSPAGRRKLPDIPGPIGIVHRCMILNENPALLPIDSRDLVLLVPSFGQATLMDFKRHSETFDAAYQWCRAELDRLGKEGNSALAAIFASR